MPGCWASWKTSQITWVRVAALSMANPNFSKPGGSATGVHTSSPCIVLNDHSELDRVMGDEDQQGQMPGCIICELSQLFGKANLACLHSWHPCKWSSDCKCDASWGG